MNIVGSCSDPFEFLKITIFLYIVLYIVLDSIFGKKLEIEVFEERFVKWK